MKDNIDPSICPLCQQYNRCDVVSALGCWCMKTTIPQELIARVPVVVKNKSCICNACIEAFHQGNPGK
jgi:hypothetical protein